MPFDDLNSSATARLANLVRQDTAAGTCSHVPAYNRNNSGGASSTQMKVNPVLLGQNKGVKRRSGPQQLLSKILLQFYMISCCGMAIREKKVMFALRRR